MNRGSATLALTFAMFAMQAAARGAESALAAPAPPPAPPAATNGLGPKIRFETMVHDFGRAKVGEQVRYTYIFTNAGDQLLELTGVQACGCITADWSRKVEPGKTGAVPIGFNTSSYNGPVLKTITITCNDRTNPRPVLQLKGMVWRPIEVIPQFAILNLNADTPLASATVTVTNNLPEPLTLSEPQCSNPAFSVALQTNEPGKSFRVVIAPVSPLPAGSVQAQVTLKTSSTNMPVVVITAYANVQPVITINPPTIALPPGPLAQSQTNTITITGNSTNRLALTEPRVNATGVDIQLKELVPGRQFAAILSFPQGFEVTSEQKPELTLNSSFPQAPALKVPIVQPPRPAPPKVVPAGLPPGLRTNRFRPHPHRAPPPLPPIPGLPGQGS